MIDFQRPVTQLLQCSKCAEPTMAMHLIENTVKFTNELNNGSLLCQCGGMLKRAEAKRMIEIAHR